jgi:Ku protein
MPLRASSVAEICFDSLAFFVKVYGVAGERPSPFTRVHAACNGELEQQLVCRTHGTPVARPAISRRYHAADGREVVLSDDEMKGAESARVGVLEILEFVPADGIDAALMGRPTVLGPDQDRGIDGYSMFVDALAATNTVAIGMHFLRTRDQLVSIEPYRERGLLMRELSHGAELRPISEIEFPFSTASSAVEGTLGLWTRRIEQRRRAQLDPLAHRDGYLERVEAVATSRLTAGPDAPRSLVAAARERAAKRDRSVPASPAAGRTLPPRTATEERPSQQFKI